MEWFTIFTYKNYIFNSEVTCTDNDLGSLDNGNISYSSAPDEIHGFGSVVTYTCNEGYMIEGQSTNETTRACVGSGQWTGTLPKCISKFLYDF